MSKITFLPTDYSIPKASGAYMRLQEGDNRIRILSAPVIGWEDWTMDKKPVRFRRENKPSASINPDRAVKEFWAFIVWNYAEEKIQILQITQKSIKTAIDALSRDEDWGAPYFYDIKIAKTGKELNTEYAITPMKPKPLAAGVKEAFYASRCNLEALFTNDDPFDSWESYTEGVFEDEEEAPVANPYLDLLARFNDCSEDLRTTIAAFLKQKKLKPDFSDLPDHFVDRIEKAIQKDLVSGKDLQEAL